MGQFTGKMFQQCHNPQIHMTHKPGMTLREIAEAEERPVLIPPPETAPPRFCKDCKWVMKAPLVRMDFWRCSHPRVARISLVSGANIANCVDERAIFSGASSAGGHCGAKGRLWEARS